MSTHATFEFYPIRFEFTALEAISFPTPSSNIFRGTFGSILREVSPWAFETIFEASSVGKRPSGFKDAPRPFIFRSRLLDGTTIQAGKKFHIDFHLFTSGSDAFPCLVAGFEETARRGFGPSRNRGTLDSVSLLSIDTNPAVLLYENGTSVFTVRPVVRSLSLVCPPDRIIRSIRITFLSPTELKRASEIMDVPEFSVVFGRVRDRISTLRALYGAGSLEVDFKGMTERAGGVRLGRYEFQHTERSRRSRRTGQIHPLGGFQGFAEYHGELNEFLPYLEAACWTGVGRQTVWGNGEIAITRLDREQES